MTTSISSYFERRSGVTLVAVAVALSGLLGVADFATGSEISFGFFYLLPVAFAAWYVGPAAGIAISLFNAFVWFEAYALAGGTHSSPVILYWNAATRFGFFFVVAILLAKLRGMLLHERSLSRSDFLTGVLNSRAFGDAAAAEILRARRYARPFTLAYIDLDNFKTVNDTMGHSAGDTLLRTVAQKMHSALRATDTVARLGGDEFAVLMPETDTDAARSSIDKLRAALLGEMDRHGWPVTFSIGVLTCRTPPDGADQLISLADNLMYEVKHSSKNGVAYATR